MEKIEKTSLTENVALIIGITGQDGAYLARFLLKKGYIIHGIVRRSSSPNTGRIDELIADPSLPFYLHYGDLVDGTSLIRLINDINPSEIYNLGAQSHVKISFETPEYTANTDALGPLRILEAIRILGLEKKVRFFQASTSELFGNTKKKTQSEKTPFSPRSPYAVAKLYAYWVTINYREAYGIHATNGILFNHESPMRGRDFVTRKITRAIAEIFHGIGDTLYLGNLNSVRDWGHSKDYMKAVWQMLQQDVADDYVIGTGIAHSVRDFVEKAFAQIGIKIIWRGKGVNEIGIDAATKKIYVKIDKDLFRPTEVDYLLADPRAAMNKLQWQPETTLEEMIKEMVDFDIEDIKKNKQRQGCI